MRNNDCGWAFLLLGNGLGFDAGLDLAIKELLDEFANILLRKRLALLEGEFLVLDDLLNSESGPFAVLQIEVLRVCSKCLGVNCREVDLALVFLG